MARLTKADSVYRMSLHKNGGYMYATTHPYTVTGDGKRKYSCLHWGTVTDQVYPGQAVPVRLSGGTGQADLSRRVGPQRNR